MELRAPKPEKGPPGRERPTTEPKRPDKDRPGRQKPPPGPPPERKNPKRN